MDKKIEMGIYNRFATSAQLDNDSKITKRVGVYIRSGEEADSVTVQTLMSMLGIFAEQHGGGVVANYIDSKCSGWNTNRPKLNKMLTDCEKGKLDEVLILRPSHLSRNFSDFVKISDLLKNYGISLVAVECGNKNIADDMFTEILEAVTKEESYGTQRKYARKRKA